MHSPARTILSTQRSLLCPNPLLQPYPHAVFELSYFEKKPKPFFRLARVSLAWMALWDEVETEAAPVFLIAARAGRDAHSTAARLMASWQQQKPP